MYLHDRYVIITNLKSYCIVSHMQVCELSITHDKYTLSMVMDRHTGIGEKGGDAIRINSQTDKSGRA